MPSSFGPGRRAVRCAAVATLVLQAACATSAPCPAVPAAPARPRVTARGLPGEAAPVALPTATPALDTECAAAEQAMERALAGRTPVLMRDAFVVAGCNPRSAALARVRALVVAGELEEGALEGPALDAALAGRTPPLSARALTPQCQGDACVVDAFFPKGGMVPKAAGGGVWSLIACHSLVKGHSDISRKGLAGRLGCDGVELVADAAQDPDFYLWNAPCAHAQSRSSADTGELVDRGGERPRFLRWERATLQRMLGACAAGEPRRALYWLGYALHGVQDLVFHEGISNAEHSYRDGVESEGLDCREPPLGRKVALAGDATVRLADGVARRYPACWAAMRAWQRPPGDGSAAYTIEAKIAIVGHGWDLDPFPYKRLAGLVQAHLAADPSYRGRTMLKDPDELWLRGLRPEALATWLADEAMWPAGGELPAPLDCSAP